MAITPSGSLSLSAYDAFLKEIYADGAPAELAMKDKPLLEYLPKNAGFSGDTYVVPVGIENPQGASSVLSTAITNAASSVQTKFVATARNSLYQVAVLDAENMAASEGKAGAFAAARQREIDGMLDNIGKTIHQYCYRSGSGSLGQASNIVDGSGEAVITLANKSDVHNFSLGQTLEANDTDNATSVRAGAPQVIERSVSAGTITVDETVVATHSWGTTDFLFPIDNQDVVMTGLAGWLPLAEPSATAFFGVDRTDDVTRLAGHRVDNSSRSIYENMSELAMLIGEEGGNPDTCFMNPRAVHLLAQEVGAKVTRQEGGTQRLGFTGFMLETVGNKGIKVVQDWACPQNRAYMLQRNTWEIAHLKGLVHLVEDDGRIALRGSTTDTIEVRGRSWHELMCRAPAYNGVFSVSVS